MTQGGTWAYARDKSTDFVLKMQWGGGVFSGHYGNYVFFTKNAVWEQD